MNIHPVLARTVLSILTFCITHIAIAQKANAAFQLRLHKASSAIAIDGVMDEQAWNEAETATDFFMVLPMDTSRARVRTNQRDPNLIINGKYVRPSC